MNAIESSTDLSLTSLTPEFKKPNESTKVTDDSSVNKLVESVNEQPKTSVNEQINNDNETPLSPKQLEKVAQQLQDFVGEMNRGLEFSVDKDSGRDVIKVIDKTSGDLVKQYPSEEVLTLVAKLSDSVGGFIDAKV
ncbi:flagellar protein FlaG [Colwellia psychrerythraea]|uniref:Flagellin FlaG n=1 Tax=Colwellia psychrerythraea (strain 34H / ATCC BAA-681) TaxID=167879 RepID=Q485N2_COLP3|nr:flagellar protein FlaG [Colwellia psychrerythraea]AAZ28367.1 flagellin FlaG [Colwellia psychrerythraea 34H]